jgi:hypothetical protein
MSAQQIELEDLQMVDISDDALESIVSGSLNGFGNTYSVKNDFTYPGCDPSY